MPAEKRRKNWRIVAALSATAMDGLSSRSTPQRNMKFRSHLYFVAALTLNCDKKSVNISWRFA